MTIEIPDFSLVVLIGATGSGKSTLAAKHFAPTEIVSSDRCRGLVIDDETDQSISADAFDLARVDVAVNPRRVTAEEIVRFALDPRTKQVAMLEGNRYEVLDVTTRESSRYIGTAFRDMPVHGALIGAIVRNGSAVFPHGDDVLEVGDRVIVFTEAANVPWVVEAL